MKYLEDYIQYYESLSPSTVKQLKTLVTPDVHFRDPFNDVRSADAMLRIMAKMFEDVRDPKFKIVEQAINNSVAFLKWRMTFSPKGQSTKVHEIVGISEIHFTENGLIEEHLDYWDPAANLYEGIPILGWVLRLIKAKLSASL